MLRGLTGKCPCCGEGRLFDAYLKVTPRCETCGEDLSHQRADDAPPYLTVVIVGHFIVAGILAFEEIWTDAPIALVVIVWALAAAAASLALLPRIKGAMVGYQWSFRMHGFGGPDAL
jgi:uncharacterized protein (DUF983 family)